MNESSDDFVSDYLDETVRTFSAFATDIRAKQVLSEFAGAIVASLRGAGKLMIAGNGGSAGDAQHIAGEFIVRLMYDRAPLAAIALTTNGSVMTACGNDYGFDHVFERQVTGLGRRGDVFLGISTSGNSPNILQALKAARAMGITTLGFSGGDGGRMAALCDHLFLAPSAKTAFIQQIHIAAAHIVCGLVERTMFP